jgi:hypothetical protein
MNELRIGSFCPTPRGCIDLVRKGAHGSRDRDTFRGKKGQLAFPVESSRRDRRIRQPLERDILEDVVWRQALRRQAVTLTVEDSCDERLTARVVVDHPGGEADR